MTKLRLHLRHRHIVSRMKYPMALRSPDNYVVRIEWDSEEGHMKGFRTGSEFQTFFAAVRPFFNDIQEMKHYAVTATTHRK